MRIASFTISEIDWSVSTDFKRSARCKSESIMIRACLFDDIAGCGWEKHQNYGEIARVPS